MPKTILLVDEQTEFRELVAQLLRPTGFVVLEAESGAEALEALSHARDLALAVVDFHLPDGNGITVLSHLRDKFKTAPIAFLSDAPMERETLAYLLNRLEVSLVLQKPIQPDALFAQLETLLPALSSGVPRKAGGAGSAAGAAGTDESDASESDDFGITREHSALDMDIVIEIEKQLANDTVARRAHGEMAANLPYEWENMAALLRRFESTPQSADLAREVLTAIREIRRAASSFLLPTVVDAVASIDENIRLADPKNAAACEAAWKQIFQSVAVGATALKSVTDSSAEAKSQELVNVGYVLLLGGVATLAAPEAGIQPSVGARVIFTDSPEKAVTKAAKRHFEAAMIDVATLGREQAAAVARELRLTSANAALPLAFVMPPDEPMSDVDRLYHGCSAVLTAPVSQSKFEECLLELAGKHSSSHARVLVIDDDRVLSTLIERVLGNLGMTVYVLNRPIGIMEILETTQPDVILLDVVMPGINGYEVCKSLRASEQWSEVPIIFLTSNDDAEGRAAAYSSGASDFLSKPILRDELILRVKTQVKRYRSRWTKGSSDALTGLLLERNFMQRAHDTFIDARRSGEQIVLCYLEIMGFAELRAAHPAAAEDVLWTLGKLLLSLFPADTLRAVRGDSGFALLFRKVDVVNARPAIEMVRAEMEAFQFSDDSSGESFTVKVQSSVVSSPAQGLSLVALMAAAQDEIDGI